LLDSIYQKLPIGAILVWDTEKQNHTLLRQSLHILPQFNDHNSRIWFLIDGQQRLSVLYQVRRGEVVENYAGKQINFSRIYLVLDWYARPQFVALRRPDSRLHYPVTDILADDWRDRLRPLPKYKQNMVRWCRKLLSSFEVPFIFVRTNKLEEVRESFLRINSKGTPISAADRAFTRASRFNLRHLAHGTRSTLQHGFAQIPMETLLQTFALARGEKDLGERAVLASLDKLEKKFHGDKEALKEFTWEWKQLSAAFAKAVDYLVANLGVPGYAYLPSDNMVATLALFFYHNRLREPNARQIREMPKWFWATGVGQRYTGRGFSRNILKDVGFFRRLTLRRTTQFNFPDRVPESEVKNTDYGRQSGLNLSFFCLLSVLQPRYLENGDKVPIQPSTHVNRKDKHHIFPKDLLRRHDFTDRQYNSLCNVCFVVAKENQSIGSKKPVDYLEQWRHRQHFRKD
jgi:hypothetical protein